MLNNKYDFILLFDVTNGNPNGDPDADNAPRTDPETGIGFVTDVCIKRKVRNYVNLVKNGEPGFNILIKSDQPLNNKFKSAYEAKGFPVDVTKKSTNIPVENQVRQYMCENYYDVRTFGAMMATGKNSCGVVRGPVQFSFSQSIDPVMVNDLTITRMAKTDEERQAEGDTEMARKSIIPYGLYRMEGHISAALANKVTDLSEDDVKLLWQSLLNMFEEDRSAARTEMYVRGLYIFKHKDVLGNANYLDLKNKIKVELKDHSKVPRAFEDYTVTVDENMPEGVELIIR